MGAVSCPTETFTTQKRLFVPNVRSTAYSLIPCHLRIPLLWNTSSRERIWPLSHWDIAAHIDNVNEVFWAQEPQNLAWYRIMNRQSYGRPSTWVDRAASSIQLVKILLQARNYIRKSSLIKCLHFVHVYWCMLVYHSVCSLGLVRCIRHCKNLLTAQSLALIGAQPIILHGHVRRFGFPILKNKPFAFPNWNHSCSTLSTSVHAMLVATS